MCCTISATMVVAGTVSGSYVQQRPSLSVFGSATFSNMVATAVPEGEDGGDKGKGKRRGNKRAGGKTQRASDTA